MRALQQMLLGLGLAVALMSWAWAQGDEAAIGASGAALGAPAGADESPDDWERRMESLEERMAELQERVVSTKARILRLQESVLTGSRAAAQAVLTHRNEMGASFQLHQVTYTLDGAPIFARTDEDGDLDAKKELEIFNGTIVPGRHTLAVTLVYKGHGEGFFSYLSDYSFKVKSSYTFEARKGRKTRVQIVGYEKGDLSVDLKDRPAVRFDIDVDPLESTDDEDAEAAGAAAQ